MTVYNVVLTRKRNNEIIVQSVVEFKTKQAAEKLIDCLDSLAGDMVVEHKAGFFKGRTDK